MTREARTMAGVILITVPTIQYGGYLLLSSLRDRTSHYMDNALRQNFFRAGHAHAGVIVILSLVCQVLADAAVLPAPRCFGWCGSACRFRPSSFRPGSFSLCLLLRLPSRTGWWLSFTLARWCWRSRL